MRQLLFILVSTPFLVLAQSIEFEEYDLDNGLHVILHKDASVPIVNVSVLYHVGSKNEPAGRKGFAHFFEHLMFEGSPNIERGKFFEIVQNAGGQLNANTSFDRTFYYETLPSHQLELGLYMESERMLQATIDSVGIATQKEVVKEEKRLRIDNQPYGDILDQMMGKAFAGTPYEWTPIGTFEDIDAATAADFKDFYATYYVPNNATLAIAGAIDTKETRKMVEKYFGEISRGQQETPQPEFEAPKQQGEIKATVYDQIQLPAVVKGYKSVEQTHPDYYAMQMLRTLLSGGESARLPKSIVNEQELALTVQSFPIALEKAGLFLTFGLANAGIEPEQLEEAMNIEIKKVQEELIPEREFQKLQNQIENDFISQNGRVAGIAESLAQYHVYFGDANLINTEIERFREVTRDDLRRVAKKYLVPERLTTLYYLPESTQKMPADAEVENDK